MNNCDTGIGGISTSPHICIRTNACADQESFVRGDPTLLTFFLADEGKEDPNTAINEWDEPQSARQCVSLAG